MVDYEHGITTAQDGGGVHTRLRKGLSNCRDGGQVRQFSIAEPWASRQHDDALTGARQRNFRPRRKLTVRPTQAAPPVALIGNIDPVGNLGVAEIDPAVKVRREGASWMD